ncbi:outer membrane protein [Tabrizicola sp. YIM 78059]|uniref:outer membrane protein n=1 Tax=Tabrizicola sp. YIM 78059 TaxID=2529861 RepID=UPI00145BD9E4|nr:outer membrane beta-barrel protein [Tabrizicola sp. YIM 78059]
MRILLTYLFCAITGPAPAFAGGPVTIASEPPPTVSAPPTTLDWSGAYAGLGYGKTSADYALGESIQPELPSTTTKMTDGRVASVHAGYLFQQGVLVYGAELSVSSLKDTGFAIEPDAKINRAIDLKGRLGFSSDRVLVYGLLGYSQVHFTAPGDEGFTARGASYGLGIDVAASDRLTIGLEYLMRNAGTDLTSPDRAVDVDLDTLSLRVGLRF